MTWLMSEVGLNDMDLFRSREDLEREAYARRGDQDRLRRKAPFFRRKFNKRVRLMRIFTIGFTKTSAE